ncbi:MAG: hypothetical protein IIA87_01825 [Nanoarchaeota archaeon]|nr:hypothetical protein [Nanoarchaeota archaeon]
MVSEHVKNLPPPLAQFKEVQPKYTAAQHEAWRYIRQVSHPFYLEHAHPSYLESIELLDIPIDTIPRIAHIDDKLSQVSFGAIGVNGFIPPRAFMALQYRGVTPISTDMRIPANIGYTPSPDIVHEGLGHTTMLANLEVRRILQLFGELGIKAVSAPEDQEYYEATRHLSILEEDFVTTEEQKKEANERWKLANKAAYDAASDARRLSALHWFTVEFGLVKYNRESRIWGAALISSIDEGRNYLNRTIRPLSLETAEAQYNITIQQETLYEAESLDNILDILEKFRGTMSGTSDVGIESIIKPEERTHKFRPTEKQKRLNRIYKAMRECREQKRNTYWLRESWQKLEKEHEDDWLAPLGILEILTKGGFNPQLRSEIRASLEKKHGQSKDLEKLIGDGLALFDKAA